MKQTTLPGTDVSISQLALGCWGLTSDFHWGQRNPAAAKQIVAEAINVGINFFDTAAMYADGANETLLGELLAGHRDQVQIATKNPPGQKTADEVKAALDASLARLQTDHIDLYQIHWAGSDAELSEVWGAMIECKQMGKVRAIGVCNLGPKQLDIVTSLEKPSTNQLAYNLLFRAIEAEILPRCKKAKIGVLAYSPLMHGMLRGDWNGADEVPPTRARTRHFASTREHVRHDEPGNEELTFETIECLKQFAEISHNSLVDLALRWLASQELVTSILVGASSPDQIRANAVAAGKPLGKDFLVQVNAITDPLKEAMGTNPDLWQSDTAGRVR